MSPASGKNMSLGKTFVEASEALPAYKANSVGKFRKLLSLSSFADQTTVKFRRTDIKLIARLACRLAFTRMKQLCGSVFGI
jgi:hypothetical protein